MRFDQTGFDIRCEWGLRGLRELEPACAVVIVVDVLSFSTAVDIATARGALVYPQPRPAGAKLPDRGFGYSLSPASLVSIPAGYSLDMPSPNGGAICAAATNRHVLTACLRNASAVAATAARLGSIFAVIPAGEMWDGGGMRPCLEDLAGAGAVIAQLPRTRSPEAELAVAAFERIRGGLGAALRSCGSGRELIERGFAADVELAAEHDVSSNVPFLLDRAFQALR